MTTAGMAGSVTWSESIREAVTVGFCTVVLGHRRAEAASDEAGVDALWAGEALLLADRTAASKQIVVNVCLIRLMRLPPSHIIRSGLALCDRSRTPAVNPGDQRAQHHDARARPHAPNAPPTCALTRSRRVPIRDLNVLSPPFLADNAGVDGDNGTLRDGRHRF